MSEAARDAKQGQQPQQQPLQRLSRRALSVACAFGLAALFLFMRGQVCPNVKLLRNESRNAFLSALRRKPTVQQTTADGAAPPRPARTTRTTTVHPPFWL